MKSSCWFAFGLLFALNASGASGTTIDFEKPEIESAYEYLYDPYVVNGVTFVTGPMGIFREDAYPGCANPENQWMWGGQNGWFTPTIWANFPESPAEPVHVVTVEMGAIPSTFLGMTLTLELYDASNQLVGSSAVGPVYDACWLARGIVTAASDVRVHHALMFANENYLDCIDMFPPEACGWRDVFIDNFTYETGPVSVEESVDAISWGRLKAQYR
jgi:hypothetical protein